MGNAQRRRTDEWYKAHQWLVQRYLYRRMRDKEWVDDVAQEVWLRVMRLPEGLVVDEPGAYLHGIAGNVLADWRVDDAKKDAVMLVEEREELGEWIDPDDLWQRIDLEKRLREALASLPEAHAAILILFGRDGMSYAEIAERLGLSKFTVEKYLTQAKALVRTGRRMYGGVKERDGIGREGPGHDRGRITDNCAGAG